MNKLNFLSTFILLLVFSFLSFGQVAVGQWRNHLPYNYGEMIAVAGEKIYMVTNVGLLSYSKNTGEVEKLSKINGLSDSGVESAAYHEGLGYVVLGYSNGNIDLVSDDKVINLSDIKRKSMTADKAIYKIIFIGNKAYLGCGFGIVVLDLDRNEISETWFIGQNGTNVKINDLDSDGINIYAATDNGVFKGNLSNQLVDFSQWENISNEFGSGAFAWVGGKSFNRIKFFNNKLIANYHNYDALSSDTLLVFENNSWSYFDSSFNEIQSLDGNINKLIVTSKYWIKLYDSDLVNYYHLWKYQFTTDPQYPLPSSAVFDANEDLWIADKNSGLVYSPESWKFEKVSINGPQNYTVFDLASLGSEVYGVSGGMNLSLGPNFYHAMVYKFTNQVWETFYYKNMPELSPYRDLVRIVVDPNDPTHYFCGSWVSGLLEFKNNQFLKLHNSSNSTLETVVGIDYTRIGGLAFDADGNLWVTNSLTSPQIHVMTPAGVWSSIDYSASIGGINLGQIIVTKDDIKWVILPQGVGLFVFDDNNTPSNKSDDKYKKLSIINETGEIISNSVFSIAEDKDGYIWVGTSKGVAVYYNPEEVFESGTFTARQVKIPRNDGTDKADILLANEIVTSIKIDGANRKWFGTQTGGVYYTSEDGLEQIYHFTKDNSPLLDNNIICSTVVPNTGEVFFGTAQGMISYRSTATEGSDDYTGVYAFPNPVKPDYVGPITITGLVAGSYVKITDISGNMVFEMRSEGGQAIWYGNDLSGRRVQTGVYMVFSTNETGSKTDITKILFIN